MAAASAVNEEMGTEEWMSSERFACRIACFVVGMAEKTMIVMERHVSLDPERLGLMMLRL